MIRRPLPEPAWHVMLLWLRPELANLPPPHLRQILTNGLYLYEYERSVIFAASIATPYMHRALAMLQGVSSFRW